VLGQQILFTAPDLQPPAYGLSLQLSAKLFKHYGSNFLFSASISNFFGARVASSAGPHLTNSRFGGIAKADFTSGIARLPAIETDLI